MYQLLPKRFRAWVRYQRRKPTVKVAGLLAATVAGFTVLLVVNLLRVATWLVTGVLLTLAIIAQVYQVARDYK